MVNNFIFSSDLRYYYLYSYVP